MANFSEEVIQLAKDVQAKYNVPASVTLATWAYESGYGKSYLATKANNFFGLSGSSINGSVLRSGRKWQLFKSPEEGFNAYGKLMSGSRYSALTAGASNVNEYVNAYAETYAPSSDGNVSYAENVLKIISSNNLTQYDTVFSGSGNLTDTGTSTLGGMTSGTFGGGNLTDTGSMTSGTFGGGNDGEKLSWFEDKKKSIIESILYVSALLIVGVVAMAALYKTFQNY